MGVMNQKKETDKGFPKSETPRKILNKLWAFSPSDEEHEEFMSVLDENGTKVSILTAPSSIDETKSLTFEAVLMERDYMYRVKWKPIYTRDPKSDKKFIVGLESPPIEFHKTLSTVLEWAKLLRDFHKTPGLRISECIDLSMDTGCFRIAVFEPHLLQAVDMVIDKLFDKETEEYIDSLDGGGSGEIVDPLEGLDEDDELDDEDDDLMDE